MNLFYNGDEIIIQFDYNAKLVEELKTSLEKRRYDPINKTWVCKNTPRNNFVLCFLQGNKPYDHFRTKIVIEEQKGLWKHQNTMYSYAKNIKTHIIAGEMRTGKTKPVLLLISKLINLGKNIGTPWFISTKSAIKGIKRELYKWNFDYEINLMTHSKIREIFTGVKIDMAVKELLPNIIVWDESHKLKNPNSDIGTIARHITRLHETIYSTSAHRFLLSGTPMPNKIEDWWNQCEVCKPGFIRESNIYSFKERYGEWEKVEGRYGEYPHLIKLKEDEIKKIFTRLSGLVSVYLKKDCLDLPEIVYNKIYLHISDEYKKYMNLIDSTYTKTLGKMIALRALSDGFMYNHEYNEETCSEKIKPAYIKDNVKIEQLKEDLDEFSDIGRMVIYCGFTASVDLVVSICLKEGWNVLRIDGRGTKIFGTILDEKICLDEMDGSLNKNIIEKLVVVGQIDAASTGLEFSASPIIIFFSNSFNAASRIQGESRPHSNNMNKTRGLEVRDYIHLPTDELILKNVKEKKAMQSVTMGEINEWISKTEEINNNAKISDV